MPESKFWKPYEPDELKRPVAMKFGEILNQKQLYSLLKTEKLRRVTESHPVWVGLKSWNCLFLCRTKCTLSNQVETLDLCRAVVNFNLRNLVGNGISATCEINMPKSVLPAVQKCAELFITPLVQFLLISLKILTNVMQAVVSITAVR